VSEVRVRKEKKEKPERREGRRHRPGFPGIQELARGHPEGWLDLQDLHPCRPSWTVTRLIRLLLTTVLPTAAVGFQAGRWWNK
jgi:hypothetical protein